MGKTRDDSRKTFLLEVEGEEDNVLEFQNRLNEQYPRKVVHNLLFQYESDINKQIFWLYFQTDTKVIHRLNFIGMHKGNQTAKGLKLQIHKTYTEGNKDMDIRLKDICVDQSVQGIGDDAEEYIQQNDQLRTLCQQVDQMKFNEQGSSLSRLQLEYSKEVKEKGTPPDDFLNRYLMIENKHEEGTLIALHMNAFMTLYKSITPLVSHQKPVQDMKETIHIFCDSHPLNNGQTLEDIKQLIETSNSHDLAYEIYRVFIRNDIKKQKTIWIYGAPNTGKTCLSKILQKIFIAQPLRFTESKFSIGQLNRNPYDVQLVLFDEANYSEMFNSGNLPNIKQQMEGEGFLHRIMYKDSIITFTGSYTLLTTNALPKLAYSDIPTRKDDWEAIKTRVSFIHRTEKLDQDGLSQFPYDEIQLAHYLKYLIELYGDRKGLLCSKEMDPEDITYHKADTQQPLNVSMSA